MACSGPLRALDTSGPLGRACRQGGPGANREATDAASVVPRATPSSLGRRRWPSRAEGGRCHGGGYLWKRPARHRRNCRLRECCVARRRGAAWPAATFAEGRRPRWRLPAPQPRSNQTAEFRRGARACAAMQRTPRSPGLPAPACSRASPVTRQAALPRLARYRGLCRWQPPKGLEPRPGSRCSPLGPRRAQPGAAPRRRRGAAVQPLRARTARTWKQAAGRQAPQPERAGVLAQKEPVGAATPRARDRPWPAGPDLGRPAEDRSVLHGLGPKERQ